MSQPQQNSLTEEELGTLVELTNRQDRQGLRAFFHAMPPERAQAIARQIKEDKLEVNADVRTLRDIFGRDI